VFESTALYTFTSFDFAAGDKPESVPSVQWNRVSFPCTGFGPSWVAFFYLEKINQGTTMS